MRQLWEVARASILGLEFAIIYVVGYYASWGKTQRFFFYFFNFFVSWSRELGKGLEVRKNCIG